jgi:cell wall assembly regulator SMI1
MSDLTDAIERLYRYFQDDFEQGNIILKPGISQTEIEKVTTSLNLHLPQEIRELYFWANGDYVGGEKAFAGLQFLSLQEASETYHKTLREAKKQALIFGRDASETWWNQRWFPIFGMEEGYYFIITSEEQTKASPVFCYDYKDWDNLRPKYKYTNLLSMIQTIAECYETGAYRLIEGEYGKYFEEDFETIEAIRLKYNPNAHGTYYDLIPG